MPDLQEEVSKYLKALKKGDHKKLQDLYDITANHLTGVARSCLINKNYSDDVVEDTYIHIWKYISSYDTKQNGYFWILKILRNVVHNYNHIDAHIKEVEISSSFEIEIAEDNGTYEDYTGIVELQNDLGKALSQLDNEDKRLVYYHFYLGQSYREIAKQTDMKKSTVCYKMRKIIEWLRKIY